MALIETLQDDFEFGGIDSGKWTGTTSKVVVGTNLDLEISSTLGGAYDSLDAITTYNLTGSSIYIQLTDVGNQAITSWEVYPLQLKLDANNNIRIRITANTIQVLKTVATVSANVGSSVGYSSSTTKWFRISESGGTITFAYAADPTGSWTTITTLANPFAITALTPQVIIGTWQAEGSTTTAKFDNINVTPASLQFDWKGYTWNKRVHAGPPANNQNWASSNVTGPDGSGYMTLALSNAGTVPIGCEIFSVKRGFGYGTYVSVIGTRLDNLHVATCFGGLFTFDFTNSPDYKEIDSHETRHYGGSVNKKILHNHAYNNGGTNTFIVDSLDITADVVQTHVMKWQPGTITFDAYPTTGTLGTAYFHTVQSTNIPTPGLERVHFNVFVDSGSAGFSTAPAVSVVVRDFQFIPFSTPSSSGAQSIASVSNLQRL